jgi:hypothetical protein
MPPRVRVVQELPTFEVSEPVGRALRPELDRSDILGHRTLATGDPPYSHEMRESQFSRIVSPLPAGASVTLATLRRAWELIGFMVNPGNAAAPGLTASLNILGRGMQGAIATVVVANGPPRAFVGFLVGARCELVVTNAGATAASGIVGEIWGMAQR